MESPWIPIPHSWREAVWLLLAVLIATRKGLKNGFVAFFRTWKIAPAEAEKIRADAESVRIETGTKLIREMRHTLRQANVATEKLKGELASKDSIIALKDAYIKELEEQVSEKRESAG